MIPGHTTPCGTGTIRSTTHHGMAGVIRTITPGIRLAIMAITAIMAIIDPGMAVVMSAAAQAHTCRPTCVAMNAGTTTVTAHAVLAWVQELATWVSVPVRVRQVSVPVRQARLDRRPVPVPVRLVPSAAHHQEQAPVRQAHLAVRHQAHLAALRQVVVPVRLAVAEAAVVFATVVAVVDGL